MTEKRIYLGFQENQENPVLASKKQLDYIDGLLSRGKVIDFCSKTDGKRLTLKEASGFITALIKKQPFILVDRDKKRELKSLRNARQEELVLKKAKQLQDERDKMAAMRNMKVEPIKWDEDKPKTFDPVPKLSFEEQQARLNNL